MDVKEDIQNISQGIVELNPFIVFMVSFMGLLLTLFFVFIFRKTLKDSYGNRVYFWFIFLIALNLINIMFMTGYYQSRYQKVIGKSGPGGVEGNLGIKGDSNICGYCSDSTEIGIQYSTKYYSIVRITKTTNILGEIGIWRAIGMLGLSSLGDTVFAQKNPSKLRTYMAGYGSQPPTDFKKLIEISDGLNKITLWQPIPPKGYSFLGHFAVNGMKKPEKSLVACLATECLIKSYSMVYVASFPAIDIIPSYANKKIKFCSFWLTPLNHLYCKVSDSNYTTNSVYYNLVEGHPEYYDEKLKEPIFDKLEEVKALLQEKPSVIYHAQKITSNNVKFNTIFVENIRDTKGKITGSNIHSISFNKIMDAINTFDSYIDFFQNSFNYINKIIEDNNNGNSSNDIFVKFINDDNSPEQSVFKTLENKIKQINGNQDNFKTILTFMRVFKTNPATVMKAFQDENKTFGVPTTDFIDMSIDEKKTGFNGILNSLSIQEFQAALNKLKTIGLEQTDQLALFDIYGKKKAAEQQASYEIVEETDPSLTLWDDLFYLFPAGLDDQIASTEEASIEGGFYLDDVENRQRKNFIDYIKTFTKPNLVSYAFRKKCMMFIDTDQERNETISELARVYTSVGDKLAEINQVGACDNPAKLIKLYDNLMMRIDKQFRSIQGYKEKIANQEFSYFPTSRLKWLLNEMNTYYGEIKNGCKSDERTRILNQIRITKDQLKNDYNFKVDFNNYDFKSTTPINKVNPDTNEPIDLNAKIDRLDTDDLSLKQLKEILDILENNLSQKMKPLKPLKPSNQKNPTKPTKPTKAT